MVKMKVACMMCGQMTSKVMPVTDKKDGNKVKGYICLKKCYKKYIVHQARQKDPANKNLKNVGWKKALYRLIHGSQ